MTKVPQDYVAMPLWDYCILELPDDEKSLIHRPGNADPHAVEALSLRVLFTGPDVKNIKPGDRLIFNPGSAVTFDFNGKQYWLVGERATGVIVSPLREIKKSPDGKLPL